MYMQHPAPVLDNAKFLDIKFVQVCSAAHCKLALFFGENYQPRSVIDRLVNNLAPVIDELSSPNAPLFNNAACASRKQELRIVRNVEVVYLRLRTPPPVLAEFGQNAPLLDHPIGVLGKNVLTVWGYLE